MEAQIVELIMKFNRGCNDVFIKRLKQSGITAPQVMTLQQIYHEAKTIGQIVEAVQLSYSTVSGIIDRLERDGWIERIRDERDRRIVWIRKTPKFDERAKQSMLYKENFYLNLLNGLSEHELRMIQKSLVLLNGQMDKKVEDH